jgi:hypothetical protein
VFVNGCASSPNKPVDPAPAPAAAAAEIVRQPATRPDVVFIDLSMYQIFVPAGAISGSDEFWGNLSPAEMEDGAADLAGANGIRVAQGDVKDWGVSKKIIDRAGADTIQNHYIAPMARGQEIPITGDLMEQTLFWFDGHGLNGQTYEHCQNLLVLAFGPSPGGEGAVRLELCPLVRATRRHYEYTILNGRTVASFVNEEHLYDIGLRAELANGKFLVVAPSPGSERTTSIGHQFFTQDGRSHRLEMVMVLVVNPKPVAVDSRIIRR